MDATNYGHLQRLGVLMNILSPGKQYWSVVEWRCKLKAVRGPAASRFDYDAWDSWLRAQAEVERQRQERLAAEREEQALVDAVRLGRLAELTAKVTAKRKRVWDIEHRYAGKAEILNTLKRELAGWELLKDVVLAWPGAGAGRWLAWPTRNDAWAGYFRRLLTDAGADSSQGGYVTLGVTGQVRGSGVGAPAWDVLLSTFPRNRPGNKADAQAEKAWRDATVDSTVGDLGKVDSSMDDADRLKDIRGEGAARPIGTTLELPTDGPAGEVLRVHNAFYDALGRGDEAAMAGVWSPAGRAKGDSVGDTNAIDRFVSRGAVLDNWGTVLRPDRRPEGLKLSDVDVTVERDQATVTVLETVANGATLLATQSFEKVDEEWVLKSHYTIPYGKDTVAKIALRCDERGCVAVPSKAVASQN